jgi:hypothetical protein
LKNEFRHHDYGRTLLDHSHVHVSGYKGLHLTRLLEPTLPNEQTGSWRTWVIVTALGAWALATSIMCSSWMASHSVPLRGPAHAEVLAESTQGWSAYHILVTGCDCSLSVARHVAARVVTSGVSERIIILGSDDASLRRELATCTIPVISGSAAKDLLSRAGVSAGPWLVVMDPSNQVVYSGGYRNGPILDDHDIEDTWILAQSRAGHAPKPFPAFGCAIRNRL